MHRLFAAFPLLLAYLTYSYEFKKVKPERGRRVRRKSNSIELLALARKRTERLETLAGLLLKLAVPSGRRIPQCAPIATGDLELGSTRGIHSSDRIELCSKCWRGARILMLARDELPPALPKGDGYDSGTLEGSIPIWWRQTPTVFQVVCELPEHLSVKRELCVDIHKERFSLSVNGAIVVDGKLPNRIVADESEWYVEDYLDGFREDGRYLVVDLLKASDANWNGPVAVKQEDSVAHDMVIQDDSVVHIISSKSAENRYGNMLRIDAKALSNLDTRSVVVLPNFVGSVAVAALNKDHLNLRNAGYGKASEIHEKAMIDGSTLRHSQQVMLPRNGAMPKRRDDGWAANFLATEFIPTLMNQLAPLPSIKNNKKCYGVFINIAELQYLHYPPGGYFKIHIDTQNGKRPGIKTRRAFSFVLFLNDIDASQGGALRLFYPLPESEQHERAGGGFSNVLDERIVPPTLIDVHPAAGTLVIFRSEAIMHEVMEAFAPRDVLVGWFHRPDC